MNIQCLFILVLSIIGSRLVVAQEIDNTTSYKNIKSDDYIRLSVDNDYFACRDRQYTEGINLEMCSPSLKKNPLTWLLINPHYDHTRYGMGIEQAGYTPYLSDNHEMQINDRPFAATLFLKTFLLATDTVRKQRFVTILSTGVLGPAAQGEELQDGVHKVLGDVVPPGWQYQIRNEVILNYQVNYEKQLLAYRNAFLLDANGSARAGTLNDKAGVGITVIVGYFEPPYGSRKSEGGRFHIYAYDHPEVDVIGYDATLEGGMFDHSSSYTIPASGITRTVLANRAGCVVSYGSVIVEFFEYNSTRQFSTGPMNKWGGLQLAVTLK